MANCNVLIVNAQCEWSLTKTNACVDFNVTGESVYLYPCMDNTVRTTQCGQHGQNTVWTTRSEQHSVDNTAGITVWTTSHAIKKASSCSPHFIYADHW